MLTPISEIIFSGFVSKIVNNGVDASWNKIKKVIKSKKLEHQNMESQIYSIIVNALNKMTYNEYKNNQDKVYQAAENLLLSCEKVKSDDIEIVRSGLKILGKKVDNDVYLEFKGIVYDEIGKKENVELYHTILLWLLDQKNKYDELERIQLNQKLDEVIQILRTRAVAPNLQHSDIQREIKSRTQEYAEKWNRNMFLNDFSDWDENAGINIKLKDVYIEEHLPRFIWRNNNKISSDLRILLSKYILDNGSKNQMLLILGQPGIGKSTLITWIVNNFANKTADMLVYQFASDLKNINSYNLDKKQGRLILGEINLLLNELEDKILILDGFDEINVGNDRLEILNGLYRELIINNLLHNFSVIITCRENYIQDIYKVECDYITLQPWESSQIQSFCDIYSTKTKRDISEEAMMNILKNKEVLGVPLILYMALSLDISVEKEGSIVDIYDQIFSLKEGGIYDRCFKNIKNNKIERYDNPHWTRLIKKQIHQISRNIAIWMFEYNSDEAFISQDEYQNICNIVNQELQLQENEYINQDFLIGNYFKLVKHCEGVGTEELCFVHRSIYEYFVAETIFNSIENAMVELSNESKKEFARNVAEYLKMGDISPAISQYLEYKIRKLYGNLETRKQRSFYRWWEEAIDKMMDVGMFYYSKPIQHYRDSMFMEAKCFINLVKMLRLVLRIEQKKYIMYNVKRESLENYIKYCATVYAIWRKKSTSERLDLSKMYLKGLDLHGIDLGEVELTDANLMETNLSDVNLVKTNLRGTNLKGADLRKADLREADLRKANLREADLRGAIIEFINNLYNNLGEQRLKSANLKEAYLNNSIWREKDICRVKQFRKAIFTNLIIEDENGRRKLGKNDIFPTKSKLF